MPLQGGQMMCKWIALALSLCVAGPVFAQGSSAFRTISPGEMSFKPVDISQSVVAPVQSTKAPSALSRFVSGIHMPSIFKSTPKIGGTPMTPTTSLPTGAKGQLTPAMPVTGH